MTNVERTKRILDAGHWVKAASKGFIITITSYNEDKFTYLHDGNIHISADNFDNYTIEVIQRIPTAYKAGDKVLVLSHPRLDMKAIQSMVGTICIIKSVNPTDYELWNEKKDDYFYFPSYCLAPAFTPRIELSSEEMIEELRRRGAIQGVIYNRR